MLTLQSSKLFSRLPLAELQALEQVSREVNFAAGAPIFKEGDPGDGVYVVKSGLVQISAALENGERHIFSQVSPGDIFGEMAVLDNQPRSACASAENQTTVYFVPRQALVHLLHRSPQLSILLMQEISGRLREFNHQYIRKLLQAERMGLVGRFASSIVHDLKNPLALISMSSELLCAPDTTEEMRKAAEDRISKQVERITTLVNDILEFTRGGGPKMVLADIDYSEFVEVQIKEIRAEMPHNRVVIEFENAPPAIKIPLNPRRLSRVFHNLFGNAVDAIEEAGKIRLRFGTTESDLLTEIEDSGPGIAPEVVDRLFEPFVTFGKPKGTGLGLSITQKIIEEHGGRISARNQPGGGAVFAFSLPRQHH